MSTKFQVGIIMQVVRYTDLEVGELVVVERINGTFYCCTEWERSNWIFLNEDIELIGEL